MDYCSLGIHPTLSTKTYYTVKTYVWKKKFKQIIIVLKNCHNIRSTTIYTNVTTFSFSLFLLSMAFLFSALFLYFSFPFFSFFAQSILVTLLVKKMHVLSLNVFLEKSILDIPSIGDGAKNTFSRFFPMRALIFSVCKNYSWCSGNIWKTHNLSIAKLEN